MSVPPDASVAQVKDLPEPVSPRLGSTARRRTITATTIGNLLEWYDFAVYAALSSVLGALFFPSANASASLLASLSVFAVGFFARPLGAFVFGRIADTRGRRWSMVILIVLMGVSTVGIGLLPTAASIGIAAPVLLVVARILQGMAIGGEFATAATYLVEIAPARRRGMYGSIIYATGQLGFALGLGIVTLLNAVVGSSGLSEGWWRLAFLLGFPILLVGSYLRRRAAESPVFEQIKAEKAAGPVAAKPEVEARMADPAHPSRTRAILQLSGIVVASATATYTLIGFMIPYLLVTIKVSPSVAYPSALIAIVVSSALIFAGGVLSDRIGRKPTMIAACVSLLVLAFPIFLLISHGGFLQITIGQIVLAIPVGLFLGVLPTLLVEMFEARNRATAMGLPYALVGASLSGTAPLISTLLITATGSIIAPAWYLMGAALLSGLVALTLRETAWQGLRYD